MLSRFKIKIINFLKVFHFVINWSLKNSKIKHFSTFILLILGTMLNIIAILQITLLLNNSSEIFSINSYIPNVLVLDNLSNSFMYSSIFIFSSFSIGAILTYLGNSQVLLLATNLEKKLTINILNLLSNYVSILNIVPFEKKREKLKQLIISSPRLAGRILRIQSFFFLTLLKSIVFLTVLTFMNWKITILSLSVFLFVIPFQYLINIRAVKFSKKFDKSNFESKKFLTSIIDEIINGNISNNNIKNISNNKFFQQNKIDYQMRLKTVEESRLVSNISKAIILVFIFVTITNFGNDLSFGTLQGLLSYVLLLLVFLLSTKDLIAQITNISRFYSQVREYVVFEHKFRKFKY